MSAITNCVQLISIQYFILMQLVIFVPLALIRNLAKLSVIALVADAFILAGLIYVFGSEMAIIAKNGAADVQLFNAKDFPLFIGSVFLFKPLCMKTLAETMVARLYLLLKVLAWLVPLTGLS